MSRLVREALYERIENVIPQDVITYTIPQDRTQYHRIARALRSGNTKQNARRSRTHCRVARCRVSPCCPPLPPGALPTWARSRGRRRRLPPAILSPPLATACQDRCCRRLPLSTARGTRSPRVAAPRALSRTRHGAKVCAHRVTSGNERRVMGQRARVEGSG